MKGNWPDEIVRLLDNWSMWVQSGRRVAASPIAPFPLYQIGPRGPRAGNVIPILGVDAERTDRIVEAMPPRYKMPLKMHYHWTARSDRSKALACNCSVNTYKDRLNEAHALFEAAWYSRKKSSGNGLRPVVSPCVAVCFLVLLDVARYCS